MIIGVPKEIKTLEARVALTPAGVRELVKHGHKVIIETNAGLGSAITDADYSAQGAVLVAEAKAISNASNTTPRSTFFSCANASTKRRTSRLMIFFL